MIAVIGLGFVGLTTALGFCEKSNHIVRGYDIEKSKVDLIKKGTVPFYEPNLPEMLKKHLNHKFFICQSLDETVKDADIIFLCVGTPCNYNGQSDLRYLISATKEVLSSKKKGAKFTLAVKSTIPPSTLSNSIAPLCLQLGFDPKEDIHLCNNPEFLREGYAWNDFIYADRIIIGEFTENSGQELEKVYSGFESPVFRVSSNTGEFIKYLSNALLSTLISFSNEFSMIADTITGIDVADAFKILHMDNRWSGVIANKPVNMSTYVYPGCGFGGYCLPKDTMAIYTKAKEFGYEANLIKSVLYVNENIKKDTAKKIIDAVHKTQSDCVGVLGLSFKPESDDVRNTPTADILKLVCDSGIKVLAYDPMAMKEFDKCYKLPITYLKNSKQLIEKCGTIVILTAWEEFTSLDYKGRVIIDARYCIN